MTSTYVPQTFQQSQQPAPATRDNILFQKLRCHHTTPAKPSGAQRIATAQRTIEFIEQQPGPSRQLHITINLRNHFNPLSVASVTGEKSSENISGDRYTSNIFTKRPTSTQHLSFDLDHPAARASTAASPALAPQQSSETQMPASQAIHYYYCYYYVFILSAISPYTTGLKALFNQSDCTGTAPTHK